MYNKTIMENGIRVITEKMPGIRSISIGVLVAASLRDEGPHKSGIAHLVEHMMFQGTGSRDSLEIARTVDASGGHMGAFTGRDYTFYHFTILDDFTTFALDLLGDVLLYSTFPQDCLDREKNVIQREIEAGDDDPDNRAHSLMKKLAWPNHPLGQSISGNKEDVEKFTREDVIYFMANTYLPNRMIVSAAGAVDHTDFVAQTRDALWRTLGESPMQSLGEPEFHSAVAVEHMPVSLVYFSIGIKAGPHASANRYLTHLVNEILGGGYSSRLFRNIRESLGLVYTLSSSYHAYMEGGMLVLEGATSAEHIDEVIKLTMGQLGGLIHGSDPVTEEELFKAKSQLKGKHLIASENSHTRMGALSTQDHYFGQHIRSDEMVAAFDNIRIEELYRLADEELKDAFANPAVALVGPEAPEHYDQTSIEKTVKAFQ